MGGPPLFYYPNVGYNYPNEKIPALKIEKWMFTMYSVKYFNSVL
jgi:hypothetical protein